MGKIIVLGAAGFLGKYLCLELQKLKIPCVGVDRLPSEQEHAVQADLTRAETLERIPLDPQDTVVHLAARQFADRPPKKDRARFFTEVNVQGTHNVIEWMKRRGCSRLIYFSTDMVYGLPHYLPMDVNHPRNPIGEYGGSKKKSEDLCFQFRKEGGTVTVFRPRAIVGPGRYGIFVKLFVLIEKSLPVPMIGRGDNVYQLINVFDCVSAIVRLLDIGVRNTEYNLGSLHPPTVYDLLTFLIQQAGSRSMLIKTPGAMVKGILRVLAVTGPEIMYKEQYAIADQMYIVDIEKSMQELSWEPAYSDTDSLLAAYREFKL